MTTDALLNIGNRTLRQISDSRCLVGTDWWRPEGRNLTPIEYAVRDACAESWIRNVRGEEGPNGVNSWRCTLKLALDDRRRREAKRIDLINSNVYLCLGRQS